MISVRRYSLGTGIFLSVILAVLEPVYGEIVTSKFVVEQETFLLGGPIGIPFEIKNVSGNRITFGDRDAKVDMFWFSAEDSEGRKILDTRPSSRGRGFSQMIVLKSRETYNTIIFLNRALGFKTAGKYAVQWRLSLPIRKEGITGQSEIEDLTGSLTINLREASRSELKAVLEELETQLQAPDVRERRWAAEAMRSMRTPLVVEFLSRSLENSSGTVQFHAVKGLEEIGNRHAVRALMDALQHEDYHVRRSAEKALARLNKGCLVPVQWRWSLWVALVPITSVVVSVLLYRRLRWRRSRAGAIGV